MNDMTWAPQAAPQTAEQVRSAPPCPEVIEAATERGITSIVHFTRTSGLKGILSTGVVKARRDLPEEDLVKHVYEPNAPNRSRDEAWHDYVNLSVTAINAHMFRYSKRCHPENKWVILEFGPEILGDPGVVFCTANNAYSGIRRCKGLQGFKQMFAPSIPKSYYDSAITRNGRSPNQTTDPQAEVLYPFELSLDHLHGITVADEDIYDEVLAIRSHSPQHRPGITLNPEAFQ